MGVGSGSSNFAGSTTGGNHYTTSSFESAGQAPYSEVNGGNGHYGGASVLGGSSLNEAGAIGGEGTYSSIERSSFSRASGVDASGFDTNESAGLGVGGFDGSSSFSYGAGGVEASSSSALGLTGEAAGASSSTFESNGSQQQIQGEGRASAQNLYQDPNPQIIRRPAQGGPVTYTQNVKIRFLQPPAIPPPGVISLLKHIFSFF